MGQNSVALATSPLPKKLRVGLFAASPERKKLRVGVLADAPL